MKKTCSYCGKEIDSRGYRLHVAKCPKRSDVYRQMPRVEEQEAIISGGNVKKEEKPVVVEEKKPECTCKDYKGQDWNCPVHKPKAECPSCHCVDVENFIGYMEPCNEYRCGICGFGYKRNMVTGEYLYA